MSNIEKAESKVVALQETTPINIIEKAVANGASVETLEKLMDLQERHETRLAKKKFDSAIASAKSEIPTIRKNKVVDFTTGKGRTNYAYEDGAEIARTVDPILSKNGLSYRYRTNTTGSQVSVTCILSHELGHSEETNLSCAPDNTGNKNTIQAINSSVTYLKRTTLKAILGLVSEEKDTDGLVTISPDKAKQLRKLADESGANLKAFCEYFGIESLPLLQEQHYKQAVTMLKNKKAQNATAK